MSVIAISHTGLHQEDTWIIRHWLGHRVWSEVVACGPCVPLLTCCAPLCCGWHSSRSSAAWHTTSAKHTLQFNNETHTFNGPLSGTTQVSQYQKGKTNLDFTKARIGECQWHQLGHVQVCTSLQTDNHASTPPLTFYTQDALPAAQPTASKHWRQKSTMKPNN